MAAARRGRSGVKLFLPCLHLAQLRPGLPVSGSLVTGEGVISCRSFRTTIHPRPRKLVSLRRSAVPSPQLPAAAHAALQLKCNLQDQKQHRNRRHALRLPSKRINSQLTHA